MKQYQPDYYDKFQCISSQCPMTCCMQWRIAVDDETLDQWDDERKKQVKEVEEGHIIELKQDGMCPFLNEQKLCEIVLKDGEGAISHTCHTFPREGDKISSGCRREKKTAKGLRMKSVR